MKLTVYKFTNDLELKLPWRASVGKLIVLWPYYESAFDTGDVLRDHDLQVISKEIKDDLMMSDVNIKQYSEEILLTNLSDKQFLYFRLRYVGEELE